MYKMFVVVLLSVLATYSVSAQISRVDGFLGNWKMTKFESQEPTVSNITAVTMNVSVDGKELKITQNIEGINNNKDYATTITRSYKLNGAVSTEPSDTVFEGTLVRYISFTMPDKLEFVLGFRNDSTPSNTVTKASVELWSLSEKGKVLTVESRTRHSKSKIVFAKQ